MPKTTKGDDTFMADPDTAAATRIPATRNPSRWLVLHIEDTNPVIVGREVVEARNAKGAVEASSFDGDVDVYPLRAGFGSLPLRFKVAVETVTTTVVTEVDGG